MGISRNGGCDSLTVASVYSSSSRLVAYRKEWALLCRWPQKSNDRRICIAKKSLSAFLELLTTMIGTVQVWPCVLGIWSAYALFGTNTVKHVRNVTCQIDIKTNRCTGSVAGILTALHRAYRLISV